jgi:hypothetical protein
MEEGAGESHECWRLQGLLEDMEHRLLTVTRRAEAERAALQQRLSAQVCAWCLGVREAVHAMRAHARAWLRINGHAHTISPIAGTGTRRTHTLYVPATRTHATCNKDPVTKLGKVLSTRTQRTMKDAEHQNTTYHARC